jgi:flavin-dependent dehydrogenase
VGDGTINVGVGLLSTFRDWKSVNTTHLMTEFAATAPDYWEISPEVSCGPPTGGRIPMAGSVHPKVGPTWAVVGDAAGSVNPFNGEGIDYAYETGRMVAGLLDEALTTGDGMALQRYPRLLDDEYGLYFKVARLFTRLIGNPAVMKELTRVGMQSRSLMDWVLRIMANLLRPDEVGPAEAAYRAAAAIVRLVPEP